MAADPSEAQELPAAPQPITLRWTFGDRVRRIRRHFKVAQAAFAESIGVPTGTVATWESSDRSPHEIVDLARRIEQRWGVSALWVLGMPQPEGDAADVPIQGVFHRRYMGRNTGRRVCHLRIVGSQSSERMNDEPAA
jgi:transcriptional regulator with XRE-family HTH domain